MVILQEYKINKKKNIFSPSYSPKKLVLAMYAKQAMYAFANECKVLRGNTVLVRGNTRFDNESNMRWIEKKTRYFQANAKFLVTSIYYTLLTDEDSELGFSVILNWLITYEILHPALQYLFSIIKTILNFTHVSLFYSYYIYALKLLPSSLK